MIISVLEYRLPYFYLPFSSKFVHPGVGFKDWDKGYGLGLGLLFKGEASPSSYADWVKGIFKGFINFVYVALSGGTLQKYLWCHNSTTV